MPRKPHVPADLTRGPFTLDEARLSGIDRWHLRGASWRRIGPRTYMVAELAEDPMHLLSAALRRLPHGAVFSGLTAAWLHGLHVNPCNPIEVTVPPDAGVSARAGIAVRRSTLERRDAGRVRGMPATSIVRTVGEVCSRPPVMEAVVVLDEALHRKALRTQQLTDWASSRRGYRGIETLRRAIDLAEPASESPMESRLRMVLVLGGLPRPRAQVSIHDRWGRVIGRPDLFYERERLGIEYDGGGHRDTLAEDNRRQNKLLNARVRLLRYTAGDVFGRPEFVVGQVRMALADSAPEPATAGAGASRETLIRASAGTRA